MKRYALFCGLAALMLVWTAQPLPAASPAEFLGKAIECNTYEKDLAGLAVDNASDADVKAFATRLRDDHTALEKDLQQLVKEKKVGVVAGTDKDHRDRLAELKKTAKGNDFDRKFLAYVVDEHEKAIKHMEECAKDNSLDGGCRTCAEKALPKMKKHLEDARALQKKLGA